MSKGSWRGWKPSTWAGLSPNGVGQQKPNHFLEMGKVAWENRRHPFYAWKVLTKGACDGCALGVSGFHDWTIEGVHLCTTRLKLLAVNTADAMDHSLLRDAEVLDLLDGGALRRLGRLAHPMRRRHGEPGFTPVGWDEALDRLAGGIRDAGGDRTAIYLTSRGITNEVYYAAGKAARALGVASVDSAARVCHAPSTVALKQTVGVAATTCSFADVLETDVIVLIGANPSNNQPVFMKYLYEAKRTGTKVVVVNPYLEPGLERYWVPSSPESAIFGTKVCDLHVPVRPGGDIAFCNAAVKELVRLGKVDERFVAEHTEGWDELVADLDAQSLDDLLADAGVDRATLDAFVDLYATGTAILTWSMGITQRKESTDGVRAIVNLALARGNVGRDGAGLMPIRGHSGVQGGAEMGAYATSLPGGAAPTPEGAAELGAKWGFEVPGHVGLTAPEMVEAIETGDVEVLWASGGNFLDVLPDPDRVRAALAKVPLRVHQDVVVTSQMLVAPDEGSEVWLLPVATRYEQEGGGTETTTERRIIFSPEIPGHRVGQARSEWRVFAEVARRARPDLADRFSWATNQELRREIAEVVPSYAGIESLSEPGDNVQYGGRHLAPGGAFPTPSGRGRFSAVRPPADRLPAGMFEVSTRRGKQFNSMVYADKDPLNGAERDHVLVSHRDAKALGLEDDDRIVLRSSAGEYRGRVRRVKLPAGTLQVHWPEGNVLLPSGPEHREPQSHVPDYTAIVSLERL
jgi:molybdopterin-dependent oxidoreductase alpha subunit